MTWRHNNAIWTREPYNGDLQIWQLKYLFSHTQCKAIKMKVGVFSATLKRRYRSYSKEAGQLVHFFRTYRLQLLKVNQCLVVGGSLLVDYTRNFVFFLCSCYVTLSSCCAKPNDNMCMKICKDSCYVLWDCIITLRALLSLFFVRERLFQPTV